MKQQFCIALATLLVGCTKGVDDSVVDAPGSGANHIGFATQVATRGVSVTTETINNFGVFGYGTLDKSWNDAQSESLPDLFDNVEVTRRGAIAPYTWDYTGEVNWNGGLLAKYSFFGYSPYASVGNGITAPAAGTKDAPQIRFEALGDVQSHVDLLSAQVTDMVSSENPVLMKFGHTLSRIGFKAHSTTADIAVKSIEITGVKYKGALTLSNSSWYSSAETKTFTLTYPVPAALGSDAKDEATATDISVGSDVKGYFMLLPQSLTANTTSKIIFHYTVDGKDVPAKEYVIQEEWEKGKAITYTVDLTTSMEAELKVTKVTITDWVMGTSEADDATGEANEVKLTYNDGGTVTEGGEVTQNCDLPILIRPKSAIEAWNTEADGTGDFYGKGDVIVMIENITLYNVENTVTINGIRWFRGNLSADAPGVSAGLYAESSPLSYGKTFKWGDMLTYSHASSADGLVGGAASTAPASSSTEVGYDYTHLSGGVASGDPCKLLGDEFMTPSRANFQALGLSGTLAGTYQGIKGRFFGERAGECTDTKIAGDCIFLPAGGVRSQGTGELQNSTLEGHYWSSTAGGDAESGGSVYFTASGVADRYEQPRTAGLLVRCVSTTARINGVDWVTGNLEAREGQATGHRMVQSPEYFGHYFKWGDKWAYAGRTSTTDGMVNPDGYTGPYYNASNKPALTLTGDKGYDYVGLSGGRASGDPCQMLGENFKTPTVTQYKLLHQAGTKQGTYRGVDGWFVGAKATACTNDKIASGCIFLPNAGSRPTNFRDGQYDATRHYYWTSSLMTSPFPSDVDKGQWAKQISLADMGDADVGGGSLIRSYGLSVRCIREN